MDKKKIGQIGEDLVTKYLINKGFSILNKNYRYKKNEIDIIAQKDDRICFIEVKKRKDNQFGFPETFVSEGQKSRIHIAAENFIIENNWEGKIRFDIAAVNEDNIEYFEDAF